MATPTSNGTAVRFNLPISPNNEINSLLGGNKWGGVLGTGVTLSYSFPSGYAYFAPSYGTNGDSSEWYAGWYVLNAAQQSAFESALSTLSNVANITFVEFQDNSTTVGEIRVAMSDQIDTTDFGAWAYYPDTQPAAGDIWLSPDDFRNDPINVGTWQFYTLIHELGHAVGLSHPFGGDSSSGSSLPTGVYGTDNIFYTVMSYTRDPSGNEYSIDRYPETPMLLDIQALQYLYGANTTHNAGDDTYTFTGTGKYFETIWDAGGSDTIDYTSSTTGATINLNEGAWSSLGKPIVFSDSYGFQRDTDSRTVWIAYGAEIENAKGSQAGDTIYGNGLDNWLYGHWGADTIFGFGGDDWLGFSLDEAATTATHDGSPGFPGNGKILDLSGKWQSLDTYSGGAGYDTLWGSDAYGDAIFLDGGGSSPLLAEIEVINTLGGDDVVDLTSKSFAYGSVTVYGGDGNDTIWSNAGYDLLYGDLGNDQILGGAGWDTIYGGSGSNKLDGGPGRDKLFGGSESDQLLGGVGIDELFGGGGNDVLNGGDGGDLLDGGSGDDQLFAGIGADKLTGGAGNDFLVGGWGVDSFLFSQGSGRDIIRGFAPGAGSTDIIQLLSIVGFEDFSDIGLAATQVGSDTLINLGGDNQITLLGINVGQLHADDFLFA